MMIGATMRALPAAAAVLALGACGTTSHTTTVDSTSIETGIQQQLSSPSADVTKTSCPSGVTSKTGTTFECSVSWSNGATGKVKVTQTAPSHFTYEPVPGSVQVPGATVEKSLQEELATQGAPNAAVNCPDKIIVKLGTTVTCDVAGAGGKAAGTLKFSFSSAAGTVDTSSVQTA